MASCRFALASLASLAAVLGASSSCKQPDAKAGAPSPTPRRNATEPAAASPKPPSARLLAPGRLRCENLDAPLAIASPRPRLSWIDVAPPDAHDVKQAAWQIRVASSK